MTELPATPDFTAEYNFGDMCDWVAYTIQSTPPKVYAEIAERVADGTTPQHTALLDVLKDHYDRLQVAAAPVEDKEIGRFVLTEKLVNDSTTVIVKRFTDDMVEALAFAVERVHQLTEHYEPTPGTTVTIVLLDQQESGVLAAAEFQSGQQ